MEQNVIQINGEVMINVDVSAKNTMCVENIMFGTLLHVIVKKYLASIMNNSAIICDKIISTEEINLMKKNIPCKTQNFYYLLAFLLIIITLLIAVSIYSYLIRYQAKQKNILPFHDTKSKSKSILLI